MRKFLKTMAFTLLGLVLSVNLMGASKTSTLTFTAACGGTGTADDGVTWSVTSDAAESTYDATKGIHYGTSSKAISYLTLTSGSFDKKITKVVVNCSDANKTAMTSVTVGGKEFGTSQKETAYNNSAYTFEPTEEQGSSFSGAVVVTMSRSSVKKALYVKSIAVTYEEGTTPTTTKTIYCKMEQGWWKENNAAVAAYCWFDDKTKKAEWPGERMTYVEDDLWSFDVDAKAYPNIIFVRVNGSGDIADWGAQTEDLTIPTDDNNMFTITKSSACWSGESCKCEGLWSKYVPVAPCTPNFGLMIDETTYQEGTFNKTENQWEVKGVSLTEDQTLTLYNHCDETAFMPKAGNFAEVFDADDNAMTVKETAIYDFYIKLIAGADELWVVKHVVEELPQITEAPKSWAGEYVITAMKDATTALVWTGIDAGKCRVEAPVADGKVTMTDPVKVIIEAMNGGGYSVKVKGGTNDGKYLTQKAKPDYNNALSFVATPVRVDIEMNENGLVDIYQTISATQKVYLLYNAQSGTSNERFRFYKDSSYGGTNYKSLTLFGTVAPVMNYDTTMYVAGNFTNWATEMQELPYEIELPADSTLEFKQVRVITTTDEGGKIVKQDTTWYGQPNEGNYMTRDNSAWLLDGEKNVFAKTDIAGTYTFSLNEKGEFVIGWPKEPVITYADTAYYVAGNFTNWAEGMLALPAEVEFPKDSVLEFKQIMLRTILSDGDSIGQDTTWYGQPNEGNYMTRDNSAWLLDGEKNVFAKTDIAGTYTFSLNEKGEFVLGWPKEPVITYADTAYYVAGNFTNWAEGMLALPAEVEFPKDSVLEFKQIMLRTVLSDGDSIGQDTTWYGQPNEGNYMTRDNSAWLLDGEKNVFAKTDIAGTYTFSLNEKGEFVIGWPKEPVITYADTAYYVAGNFTNWAEGMLALPAEVEFPKDSVLEFKQIMLRTILSDGDSIGQDTTWYGQPNEGNYMTRDNSAWLLDGEKNVFAKTDIAGTYTFSLNEKGEFVIGWPKMVVCEPGYAIMVNGERNMLTLNKEQQEWTEYMIDSLSLQADDEIVLFDTCAATTFAVAIKGYEGLERVGESDTFKVTEEAYYSFYLKLIYGADELYVVKHEEPQPICEPGYAIMVNGERNMLTLNKEQQEWTEYMIDSLSLQADDEIVLFDTCAATTFAVAIKGYEGLERVGESDTFKVTEEAYYSFYLKLIYGADELYVVKHEEPQPICEPGYAIMVNGERNMLTLNKEQQEWTEYMIDSLSLQADDEIVLFDTCAATTFAVAIKGYEGLERVGESDTFKVTEEAYYSFYLKLIYGADELYVVKHEEPQPICEPGYAIMVNGERNMLTLNKEQQEWTEYMIDSLSLQADDEIVLFDTCAATTFAVVIKGYEGLERVGESDTFKVTEEAYYSFYLKLIYGADELYVVKHEEPQPTKYYAKNNWNGAAAQDWTWLEMSATDKENVYMLDSVVFGGTGVNINTKAEDADALWFAADAITVLDVDGLDGLPTPIPPRKRDTIVYAPRHFGAVLLTPQLIAGDTIKLYFNAADSTLKAAIVGRPEQPQPAEVKYYITGNAALVGEDNAWNAQAIEMIDSTYTFTELAAGEYEMKITNGAWDPEGQSWGSAALSEECSAGVGDKDGNIHFIVETPNDVTVSIAEGKVTVTGTFKEEPVEHKFYVTGNAALVGEEKAWQADAIEMVDDTHTFPMLAAGEYQLKVTDGTWEHSWGYDNLSPTVAVEGLYTDVDGNICFTVYTPNDVTITISEGHILIISGNFKPVKPTTTDYYLVGWINGADSGCESDYEALHEEYKFVDGKLTTTFTTTSYVFVKTSDNSHWYLSENYVEPAAKVEATLAEGKAEKVGVNGNIEVTFMLTENADGTITLAYEESGEPQPTKYYIKNNWSNGQDWTWVEMQPGNDSYEWEYTGVIGALGVNISTSMEAQDPTYYSVEDGSLAKQVGSPEIGTLDTVTFYFDSSEDDVVVYKVIGKYQDPTPATPDFGLLVNGTNYLPGTPEDKGDLVEYAVSTTLAIGDFVQLYDNVNKAAWTVTPEGEGFTDFDIHDDAYYIKQAGNYQFYIKIPKEGMNSGLYVGFQGSGTGLDQLNGQAGQRYNIMGQRVSEDYQGIVIMNGQKFLQK